MGWYLIVIAFNLVLMFWCIFFWGNCQEMAEQGGRGGRDQRVSEEASTQQPPGEEDREEDHGTIFRLICNLENPYSCFSFKKSKWNCVSSPVIWVLLFLLQFYAHWSLKLCINTRQLKQHIQLIITCRRVCIVDLLICLCFSSHVIRHRWK